MESVSGAASCSAAAPRFPPSPRNTKPPHNNNPARPAPPVKHSQPPHPPHSQPGAARRPPRDNQPRNEALTAANQTKVIVAGYASYTQAQDLLRVFAKVGNVKVDRMYDTFAILNFSTPEEVKAALASNRKIAIYGKFIAVRPYSERQLHEEARQSYPPKKDFKKTKQKVPIIEPTQIDLTGDFHHQVDNILAAVRLTQEDVTALSKLYTDVELVLQSLWPGCTAIPFGSITTGLGIKSSDADCFVNIPPQFRYPSENYVTKAKRLLQQHPKSFSEILSIPRANTPIVKFFHVPTETNCDLTFKTPLGARNSKLIAFLLHADPRLIPMAVLIKYWARIHDISGTGKLTNYALTMMIIFYLQQPHVGILPSVEWLQRDSANDFMVDFWNTGFMCNRDLLHPTTNRSTISELLGGFFEYYAQFNFEEMLVCPFMGVPMKKLAFRDIYGLPKEFDRYKTNVVQSNVMPIRFNTSICVQDPFEQCHNVSSAITTRLAHDIKAYLKFVAATYEKEKSNKCENFLRIILLQKPKLLRGKNQPEYRVNLFPRIIVTIVSSDWKSVVRDIIFTIFENMMKIKLGKVEEKVNPDTRKEKEKYSGTVTKAIWKRKQLNKLYGIMNMDFGQKQERITEEIMAIDKEELKVQFQLVLTYCHEPRSAVVSVRLSTGDVDAFREFGKFFISVMQNWFTHQLKNYATTQGKDMATKIAETIQYLDGNADANEVADTDDDSPTSGYVRKVPEETEQEGAASDESPANESPANESPANDSTANESTANDSTANDSTTNDSTANDSTANDSPATDLPANGSTSNDLPANGSTSNDLPANGSTTNDLPANGSTTSDSAANKSPSGKRNASPESN